ncbi:MAG: hypothetical protein ACOZF0_16740 [Thermodesulfobacteriota bacterium]
MKKKPEYRYGCTVLLLWFAVAAVCEGAEEQKCRVLDPDIAQEYKGECKDGLANGKGLAKGKDTYEGEFLNGKPHGKGTYSWHNGDVYKGDWVEGMRSGWGTLKRPNGAYYEGEWKNGNREGNGAYRWQNGAYYEGEWRNDVRHGNGIYFGSDNSYYKGEWRDGLQHGRGLYRWPDGTYIKGKWEGGKNIREETREITVSLDQQIVDLLEAESRRTGESLAAIITRAIQQLFPEEKEKKPEKGGQ